MKAAKNLIFVFLVVGLFFIAGCSQYFGQEARGQRLGEQYGGTAIPDYEGWLLQKLDVDSNGEVNYDDFFMFSEAFGKTDSDSLMKFDFNSDGVIDQIDAGYFTDRIGKKVPQIELPQPIEPIEEFNPDKYWFNVGDSINFGPKAALKVVSLLQVSEQNVFVAVGKPLVLRNGESAEDFYGLGYDILNNVQFYDSENKRARAAEIVVVTKGMLKSGYPTTTIPAKNNVHFLNVGGFTTIETPSGQKSIILTDVDAEGNIYLSVADAYTISLGDSRIVDDLSIFVDSTFLDAESQRNSGVNLIIIPALQVGGGETFTTPSIMESVYFGENIVNVFGDVLDGEKISSLFTGKVIFNGKEYKTSEKMYLNKNKNITLQTSLTSSDDDYQENVVLEFEKGAIQYIYSFDEPINVSKSIDKTRPSDLDLTISFMGKKFAIISVESSNRIYAKVDDESPFYSIQDGDSYFGGDGVCEDDYKDPDCWKFIVKNMDADGVTTIFNDVQKGIYYGANGPVLGLKSDFALNDNKDNPPGPGGCVRMPEKYLGVCFNGLNYEDEEAMDLKIARDTGFDSEAIEALVPSGLYTSTAIYLGAAGKNGLLINLTAKDFTKKQGMPDYVVADKVWLSIYDRDAVGVYYENTNGITQLLGWVNNSKSSEAIFVNHGSLVGRNEDEERIGINIGYEGTRINLEVRSYLRWYKNPMESLSSFWTLDSKKDIVGLGKTQAMEEAEELMWFSGNTAVALGTKDENHRTKAGIIVENPKANGASDAVRLKIPYGIVRANIVIEGRSGKAVPAIEVPQPVGGQTGIAGGGGGGIGEFISVQKGTQCVRISIKDLDFFKENGYEKVASCGVQATTTAAKWDYNGNGCADVKNVDGVLMGEDGEAFMKYYNDGDKRADIDYNDVVDIEDFFAFIQKAGENLC